MKQQYHTPQGTGAWLNQRVGNLTASRMADAMARLKPTDKQRKANEPGSPAEARRKYLIEIVCERLTGDAVPHYVNDFMRWGIEQEPNGKAAFEARTGLLLTSCGYHTHPAIAHFGATPDSLVDADWVFELKCPQTKTHIEWMLDGDVPEQHRPQILAQLACTGRKSAWFCSYDPRLPEKQSLMILPWHPPAEEIAKVEAEAIAFLAEADALFQQITESQP